MDNSNKPLVSIVTPSYNQGEFIEDTILSVKNQDYPNIEHIIVDGGSTDNTLEILEKYQGKYNMRWISEADKGQSDAVNKGFKMTRGEIIGWLNSDDVYFNKHVIRDVVSFFNCKPNADVVYGDLALIDRNGLILKIDVAPSFTRSRLERGLFIPQPASFIKKNVLTEYLLDENLKFFMDYDFWLRISERGYKFYHLRRILAAGRHYPQRKTLFYKDEMLAEYKEIIERHIPKSNLLKYYIKVGRLYDRFIVGIPRRIEEIVRFLELSPNDDFAFPAKLDSHLSRLKRMCVINVEKLIDKMVYDLDENRNREEPK